jgi:hypothetical protein
MASTPIFHLPYPEPSDPDDVPADMGALAIAVEDLGGAAPGFATLGSDGKVPEAQLPAVTGGGPPIVLAANLPAAPANGQQAIVVDNLAAPTWSWLLQWSATANRWLFIGGAAAQIDVPNADSTSSVNYVEFTVPGPSFTCPRAGVYEISFGAVLNPSMPNSYTGAVAPKFGAAATSDNDSIVGVNTSSTGNVTMQSSGARVRRSPAMAAADVIKLQFRSGVAGSFAVSARWMQVRPVYMT